MVSLSLDLRNLMYVMSDSILVYLLPYTDESTSVGSCGIVWEGLENKRRAFPWLAQINIVVSRIFLSFYYIENSITLKETLIEVKGKFSPTRRRNMHVMAKELNHVSFMNISLLCSSCSILQKVPIAWAH